MGQLQKVSWRTAGYAALGTALAAASVIAVINSDGVKPTALTSNAATRWLVDRFHGNVVLVDGLAGHVLAKITTDSDLDDEVAVQGAGGAFLVSKLQGSVRTISTAKLQLGTAQPLGMLTELKTKFGVGASGLTVVNPESDKAKVVAVDDVSRDVDVPTANEAMVAADGSMWLLSQSTATHVNIDASGTSVPLRSELNQQITVGAKAVAYDPGNKTVRWLDGADIDVDSVLPNASDAILQQSGDAAPCVWIGADDTLACVGATGVDRTLTIDGMHLGPGYRLAVAGDTAVIVDERNGVTRIDLENERFAQDDKPDVEDTAPLAITSAADMIWLDEPNGTHAWVVQRFGINVIDKDADAPLLDEQGQVQDQGNGLEASSTPGGPDASGDDEAEHIDPRPGVDDPPVAIDDSVTARAGQVITIPVTANDYDPDGDAIAVLEGDTKSATHGSTDVLTGTSITYRPETGYSGTDSFDYTIVDEAGNEATATVNVELFSPDSPNRPPIARADTAKTRVGRPVTIDVLANDIDPERDMLTVSSFQNAGLGTITDIKGPTGLPALLFTPPVGQPGNYQFTYQSVDPQGGISQKTLVTVEVSSSDSQNSPPVAVPDSIRLSVGVMGSLDVKANDIDDDGDDLNISYDENVKGVDVKVAGQRLNITLQPGAADRSVIHYNLMDGHSTIPELGSVLILRTPDSEPNKAPVANADSERVVVGNTVKIAVTANDADPEHDPIRVLSATSPSDGVSSTSVEGNAVRFTPNLPDITEPTQVNFSYTITDGHANEATGNVTVTVLVEALPSAPIAADDFGDTVTNKPVTIDVLANDSDPSGGKPTLIANPVCGNGGDAVRTSDDRVTFTPPTGETGNYKCKYTVSNAQGLRAEASIIITVTPAPLQNSQPLLDPAEINQTVNVGGTLTLTAEALANDIDGDSLVFTAASIGSPSHGVVTNFTAKTSQIVYTAPKEGSPDRTPTSDNLNVVISDGHDGNVQGIISIKIIDNTTPPTTPVTPVAPTTHEIQRAWPLGDPLTIDVLAELRDSNPNTTLSLTTVSVQSGPGTATLAGGLAVINPTGAGTIVANYTVTNTATLAPASDRITVVVTAPIPANPPVANNDAMTIDSGGSNSIDLLANDTGISDPGDVPSLALVNRPPSSFGSVELINSTLTFVAAPSASGNVTIRYSLTDGTGTTSTASVTLTVLPCGESLPNARAANIFTPYQTPIDINLNDYVTSGHVVPGSVSGAGLSGITGTYVPPPGMNGTETVTYVVQNGCQQTFQGVLTIDVNRAPVGGNVTRNVSRGTSVTVLIGELASDDEALSIVAPLIGAPSWVSLDGTDHPTSLTASPPSNASSGAFSFNVTVQDLGGLTATYAVTFVISNLPPTAIADNFETELTDTLYTVPDPTTNDSDSEPGPLTIQTASVISGPGSNVSVTGNNIILFIGHGVTTLSYTIVDVGGLTATSTITITSNRAPTISGGPEDTNGEAVTEIPLDVFEPDADSVQVVCQAISVTGGDTGNPDDPPMTARDISVNLVINPDPGPPAPDPQHPKLELEVTVPPRFNADPTSSVTIHCTVTDGFGARGQTDILLTV